MPKNSDVIAIVTVHGTGDTAKGPDGEKWFQRGSAFSERLKRDLAAQGIESEIVPHLWSGANSAWERERGADRLAALIRRLRGRYAGIHIIGHSHGGNVANDAAVLLKWGLRRHEAHERFDSLITVGTPFFDVRTGWIQAAAGIVFLVIAWGSAIAFPITALFSLYSILTGSPQERSAMLVLWLLYIAVIGPSVLFMLNLSRQGIRRILRPRRGGRTKTQIFSIWHDNDEAISFLERVQELPVEAFPRGSLFRGSRGAAISLGVLSVIAIALLNPLAYAFHWADVLNFEASAVENSPISNVVALTFLGLLFAPAVFIGFYAIYRFVIGGAQEVGARGSLNRFVAGVLRGIAYGRDGDQVLCNVSPQSHTHETQEHKITGECAARMQVGAHDAAGKLIDKYRWALFSVGGDSSASLTSLTTDAMTWDSLIHTTYFDQPEVADTIAAYIVAKVKRQAFSAPPAAPVSPPPTAPAPPQGDVQAA
ncbi:MAG: hypothetical protein JSS00_11995 [Proteobacteria bacterium]|nr:hypothetical protein [Pseudomonadota bacterium]